MGLAAGGRRTGTGAGAATGGAVFFCAAQVAIPRKIPLNKPKNIVRLAVTTNWARRIVTLNRNDISVQYARKLASASTIEKSEFAVNELNAMALSLPFAEAHLIAEDRSHVTLSILGDDVSVRDHVRDCFFDILGAEHRLPIEMTKPFLISKERLEALEQWPEWKMLQGFVFQYGLEPTVVFRNTPVRKGRAEDLYVADLRMLYISTSPVRI